MIGTSGFELCSNSRYFGVLKTLTQKMPPGHWDSWLPLQGARVWSLVRELRHVNWELVSWWRQKENCCLTAFYFGHHLPFLSLWPLFHLQRSFRDRLKTQFCSDCSTYCLAVDIIRSRAINLEAQDSLLCVCVCVCVCSVNKRACVLSCFNHVRLFVTPWTAAHQAPLSLGFSRQEYWSGLPFPSPQACL